MAVHVEMGRITADLTDHQARPAGLGGWSVSCMPGRTLKLDQAVAAMQLAEIRVEAQRYAALLKLPLLEAMGCVMSAPTWPKLERARPCLLPHRHRGSSGAAG